MLLFIGITLSLPVVQSKLGKYTTDWLNKTYKTNINVDQVNITIFGGVKLKRVMIKDHHLDTLIYANRLKTNVLDIKKLIKGDLFFGDVRIDSLFFNLKQYKGEKENNIVYFSESFKSKNPDPKKKFLLTANNSYISNGHFTITNENDAHPKVLDFTKLNIATSNLKIFGPDITTKINKMSFKDSRGIFVENLTTLFSYNPAKILGENLNIKTKYSSLKLDLKLSNKNNSFGDFANKVFWNLKVHDASLSSNDVRFYYKELGKNQIFNVKTSLKGTLNDLYFSNLNLKNDLKTHVVGDVNFKNILGNKDQDFYMNGNFEKINSSYDNLIVLLPNILGKKLPSSLQKLGQFNIKGKAEITASTIKTDVLMNTVLGNVKTNLSMSNINNIDNASYKGNIDLNNFNIGKFLNRTDVDFVTLNIDVDGKGFTQKYLNTKAKGKISKIKYNNYSYSNILVNGNFKSPIFNGKININDPNLFMDFDGLVDFSKKEKRYNFHTKIDYANLKKLGFLKDSTSIFRGDVSMNVTGNTIDNLQGTIKISETAYQNKKDNYIFDDFTLTSFFDQNRVRTITVNSPDIIDGKVVGKFQFNQLRKMLENAAGSLYTNYKPNKVLKGQFLKFNFNIYSKIIEIFYPGIELGSNTELSGNINSDLGEFKMNFKSPNIKAFDNYFDKININIDNKNPLYNAYIEMDSIKMKKYKVSNFSLINITAKDTLFVRTEFKGGDKAQDSYNLNLYHTINKNKNSVIGIKKSEINFKNYSWTLNENEENNKVIFDKTLKNFTIENIVLSHENQRMNLSGEIKGENYKDLEVNFEDVDLSKILPSIPNFTIAGNLNGNLNLKQNNAIYQSVTSLKANALVVNNIPLGNLNLDIEGDESFKKFKVNSSLERDDLESFLAQGNMTIENKKTNLDLDLRFDKFNLGTLAPLGKDVISNIKGLASGSAYITGSIDKPNINGRLFLQEAGIKIPYLNTNYNFGDNSIVDLSDNQFIAQNITLIDEKFNTKGKLNGSVNHTNFTNWSLDLMVTSNRLLALNTEDSEDVAYFGTAFIDGTATVKGPTSGLFIEMNAKSSKGTKIKIPINSTESVGNKSFIHFLNKAEKNNIKKGIISKIKDYEGLELKFNLDINPDAEIEIILDRATEHGMVANGNGNLLLEINTLGKFKMTGDFVVDKGVYNFKYKGLIDKKFDVKPNSSISWEGDPMKARLNLEAIYNVISGANPAVLLDNTTVNKKVDVEVAIGLSGSLVNPEPEFNINFPRVSSVIKSQLEAKLNDKDIVQTQALSLLATGSFVSNEGLNISGARDNLFETVSGIFDKIFQNPEDKVKFDLTLKSADRTPGRETDGLIGVNISTQLNDRISVNGKLGIPLGGINQSAIVGNVEVQYRVNEDGTLNLKFFNRENEIKFIGQGIGYTQGGGINYEVDFDTFSELISKIFNKKKAQFKQNAVDNVVPDSDSEATFNTNDKKKKKSEKSIKPNIEGIPPRED